MANKFFGWVEQAGVKVLHVVEEIPAIAVTTERLLVDGSALEPAVKTSITLLISDAEAVATTVTSAVGAAGGNWLSDAAAVAAVEKLVKDFIAQLPTLESAGKTLAADVKPAA